MDFAVISSQAPHLYDVVRQLWPVLGPYSLLGVILILHQSTRSKATTDDVHCPGSQQWSDNRHCEPCNGLGHCIHRGAAWYDCDFLRSGFLVVHYCHGNGDGNWKDYDDDALTGGLENLAPDHFANVTDMFTDAFFWWVYLYFYLYLPK